MKRQPLYRSVRLGRSYRMMFIPLLDEGLLDVISIVHRKDLEREVQRLHDGRR